MHASPVTHALQTPSWQTMPEPQGEPFCLLSLSVHTGEPLEQTIAPVRHGLLGTSHELPAEQASQTPFRQTPLSQGVPLDCGRCVSLQVGVPLLVQTVSPTWQELVGLHGADGVHVVPSGGAMGPSTADLSFSPSPILTSTVAFASLSLRTSERLTSPGASEAPRVTSVVPASPAGGRSGMLHPNAAAPRDVATTKSVETASPRLRVTSSIDFTRRRQPKRAEAAAYPVARRTGMQLPPLNKRDLSQCVRSYGASGSSWGGVVAWSFGAARGEGPRTGVVARGEGHGE